MSMDQLRSGRAMERELRLAAMPYLGGKSARSNAGTGRWVASLLPDTPLKQKLKYCEPFAGMLGVLLQRHPSAIEIANDISGHVTNWWRVVRDDTDGLIDLLWRLPPLSEDNHNNWVLPHLDEGTRVERAAAFTYKLMVGAPSGKFSVRWRTDTSPRDLEEDRLRMLAARMRSVFILNRDANDVLEKTVDIEDMVIYCDPPYITAKANDAYGYEFDKDRMSDLVGNASAMVGISGINDEWDHLGWRCEERPVKIRAGTRRAGEKMSARVEKVWMNYEAEELWNAN